MVIIMKSTTSKTGYQVQAAFNIGQHSRDIDLLNKIQGYLGCGRVYQDKTNNSRIVVLKFSDILNRIVPHFNKYPLMNRKQQSFIIWCQVVSMIEKKEHLTKTGLEKIRLMRENMRLGE
uniref:LAGLIDADG endonuclease n=1 Tax=Powellomyces hirtus TaxID=109895 RepID=A0A4P8NQ00_9FUNG|nr:LAGLIDADG endonuclease [Powellomyces hirtus]